jgi:hypothetical protein
MAKPSIGWNRSPKSNTGGDNRHSRPTRTKIPLIKLCLGGAGALILHGITNQNGRMNSESVIAPDPGQTEKEHAEPQKAGRELRPKPPGLFCNHSMFTALFFHEEPKMTSLPPSNFLL